jgi:predicted dehydrogenase
VEEAAFGGNLNMRLKTGLIGCGDIGSLRAKAISMSRSLTLDAVSDVDETRAGKIANQTGASIERDWHALLNRADLDAVVVSTPPHLHAEMCSEALRKGKHVLCEKPLARNPEECRRILNAVQETGLFLATGFNYRFYPSFEAVRSWLLSGRIGKIDHIRAYAGYSAGEHNHPWVHDAAVTGGGALRDNGIHLIDLTRFFLGEISQSSGFVSNNVWKFQDCEDNGYLIMRTSDGSIATLHASWTEWRKYRFSIEIYGSRGCIRATCFPLFAELIENQADGSKAHREIHYFAYLNMMEHLKSYRWIVIQSLVSELGAFAAGIRKEPSVVGTGYDGLRAIEIADTAMQQV